MKQILSVDELEQICKPYLPDLILISSESFNDYLLFEREYKHVPNVQFKEGEICNFIQPFFRARAQRHFAGNENIICKEFNGVFGILVHGKVFIRFNKIDEYSEFNSDTKQSEAYINQTAMPGFPADPTFMVLGFEPNPYWTSLKDVRLVCRRGHGKNNIIWMDGLLLGSYKVAYLPFRENQDDENMEDTGRVLEK